MAQRRGRQEEWPVLRKKRAPTSIKTRRAAARRPRGRRGWRTADREEEEGCNTSREEDKEGRSASHKEEESYVDCAGEQEEEEDVAVNKRTGAAAAALF
jgi:hypothetical protein